MINDPDNFKHDRSLYERPNFRFRCGRESRWDKPCHQGPNPDGSCGGTTECTPFKNKQGRYECRRPTSTGGSCADGPLPDGSCSERHPPCVPRLTLRACRERLAFFTFSLVFALIGFLLVFAKGRSETFSPLNPGPLSQKHAEFTKEQGCVSCHAAHRLGTMGWFKAAFTRSDLTAQCMSCHVFGGPERKAHNANFPARPDLRDTTCVMCHTEHKGSTSVITKLSDAQCTSCHTAKFTSFSEGHPPFPKDFPHASRTAVQFDHVAHLNKYFKDARFAKQAPQSCTACHTVERSSQIHVKTGGFEQNCASCHAAEMSRKDLVIFRLPEIAKNTIDPAAVREACPPSAPLVNESGTLTQKKEEFESISSEEPTLISAFLLGVDSNAPETYSEPMQKLILAMAKGGSAPLAQLIDKRAGTPISSKLLAGLDPETVKRAACAWASNKEYDSPLQKGSSGGGWYADLLELRYKPVGHEDSVARNWIDFVVSTTAKTQETGDQKRFEAMRDGILSQTSGVGSCTQCHTVSTVSARGGKGGLVVEWKYRETKSHPYTVFSHGAHVKLLGGTSDACTKCHAMNLNANYAASFTGRDPKNFVSNFNPIKKETCTQCHGAGEDKKGVGKVRQDCMLCHVYHLEPGLSDRFQKSHMVV